VEKYRKKLLAQVITIFLICLIVILERVFYQMLAAMEENTLSQFQMNVGLTKGEKGKRVASGITNGFLGFFGKLSEFHIQFLLLTHLLATIYVAVDALLATKILYISMATLYFVSVIQMLYTGARPYW
jgi:hypothetical protein